MTLLNASALFAAIGLLVPIAIHLHRKRKAKVVEWPAMQFLTSTLASRRRGLALENLLLLFVRCLVVLLFALAMAQPFVPSGGVLPLLAPLALMTGGLIGLTVSVIRSLPSRTRVAGFVAAAVLMAGAAAMLNMDPEDFSSPGENCDLVIVLDETSSMLMAEHSDGGQTRFADAVDNALLLLDRLSGSSTVSIVRCGPVVETINGSPFRDLPTARKILTELTPTGGGARISEAIDQAVALAKKGPNSRRQVIFFTDDQLRTWESFEESNSRTAPADDTVDKDPLDTAASEEKQDEGRVHLAVHLANLPDQKVNASVVGARFDNRVSVGQPLLIEADVRNHCDAAVANADIRLSIDGDPVAVETIDVLSAATTTTVRFPYTFETAGEHVVTIEGNFADMMMDDNRYDTVVSVAPFVSLLLVNGNAFAEPGDQSATFLQLSLDPIGRPADDSEAATIRRPIRVESVLVPELREMESLSEYDVVVLSEVPQLPDDIALRMSKYVEHGGGLWVIPDEHANAAFYNSWNVEGSDTAVLPATLIDYQTVEQPAAVDAGRTGIDLQTIASGFVSELIKTGEHDLTEIVVSGYRRVILNDSSIAAMKLTNGDPLFVEHSIGHGRVLLQTVSLGRRESNLPQRVCFPVLTHLWSYFLADCQWDESNFEPAPELSVQVSSEDFAGADIDSLLLTDPTGEEQEIRVVPHSQGHLAQINPAGRPGIYTLSSQETLKGSQSFTIARDGRESDLSVISQQRLDALESDHDLQWLTNANQLRIAGIVEAAEHEISPHLLLTVLCLIGAESTLAAWVRSRRTVALPVQPAATRHQRPKSASTFRRPELKARTPEAVSAGGAK